MTFWTNYIINGGKVERRNNDQFFQKIRQWRFFWPLCLIDGKNHNNQSLPKIEEVFRIIEILESVRVKTAWQGKALKVSPRKLKLENWTLKPL